jgi:hypothetical protein
MRLVRTLLAALTLSIASAIPAQAAPVNLTLLQATTFSSGRMTVTQGGQDVTHSSRRQPSARRRFQASLAFRSRSTWSPTC